MFQDAEIVGIHVLEADADALRGVLINDGGVRFEVFSVGVDFEKDLRALFEGIRHLDVTAVEAEFGDAGRYASLGVFLDQFDGGGKGIPGSSASLIFHECTPDGNCGILP